MYVNKADLADKEMSELVELEIKELLEKYGYDPNSPVIHGMQCFYINWISSLQNFFI